MKKEIDAIYKTPNQQKETDKGISMYTSLSLSLELRSSLTEAKCKRLEKRIAEVLNNSELDSLIKTISLTPKTQLTPLEIRRAGGLARAAALTPEIRRAIARRAANTRWAKAKAEAVARHKAEKARDEK